MSFDLFQGLDRLSSGDTLWFDQLSAEEKKQASPFVMARWMTGTTDRAQLIRLNTFVNPYVFPFGSEKALLFKLLAAASTGRKRYQWLKAPATRQSAKLRVEVIKQYYEVSMREASTYLNSISASDIMEMAEALGWSQEELTSLKKEINDGSKRSERTGSSKAKVHG